MTDIDIRPIDHASAWKGSDFKGPDDFAYDLQPRHLAAFARVVERAKRDGVGLQELRPDHVAMPEIEDDLKAIRDELMEGRSLVVLRGFPIDTMSDEELGIVYWAVGTYFGRGVSQSPMGDRLGYVTDVSKPGTRERGYRSAMELRLHTDSDDIVGLLCVRQAKSGGMSRLASSVTIHNEIAATRPDLLAPLYEGFHYHWFGEQPPGQGVVSDFKIPVFCRVDGKLSSCYLREFIEMGAEALGEPLTDVQVEALDLYDTIANREDIVLTYSLEPGWASFINNYTVLHSRTSFEDWPELERRRLLLRLWLKADPPRPIDANLRRYYGDDGMHVDGRTHTYLEQASASA